MPLSEQQLINWSKPVSTTEDEKCKIAVSQVTDATRKKFGNNISIFLQGSYENNTNVKQDSDVDIVVRHDGYFFPDIRWLNEQDRATYKANHPDSTYTFEDFKQDVYLALSEGLGNAKRKNKCILVPGNTYRVNADVVPCFELWRYTTLNNIDAKGIKFRADDRSEIESYPEQHYKKGVGKNGSTKRMYKRMVRILKRIRNELIDAQAITDKLASSFFIECLVYNVPDDRFIVGEYRQTLRSVIAKIYNDMLKPEIASEYEEVSGLKWLFKGGKRNPDQAKEFMDKSWNYAGFE